MYRNLKRNKKKQEKMIKTPKEKEKIYKTPKKKKA